MPLSGKSSVRSPSWEGTFRPKRRQRSEGQRGRRRTRLRLRLAPQPARRAVPAAAHTPPPAEAGRGRAPALGGGGGHLRTPPPRLPHAWGSARPQPPPAAAGKREGAERHPPRDPGPAPGRRLCSALLSPLLLPPLPAPRTHTALRRPGPHPSPGRGEAAVGRPGLSSHAAATPRRPPPRLGPARRCAARTGRHSPRAQSYRSCPLRPLLPLASLEGAERRRGALRRGKGRGRRAARSLPGAERGAAGSAPRTERGAARASARRIVVSRGKGGGVRRSAPQITPFVIGERPSLKFRYRCVVGVRGDVLSNPFKIPPRCPTLPRPGQGSPGPPISAPRLAGSSHFHPPARGAERRHPTSAWPGSRKPAPSARQGGVPYLPLPRRNRGTSRRSHPRAHPPPPPAAGVRARCPGKRRPRGPSAPHGGAAAPAPLPPPPALGKPPRRGRGAARQRRPSAHRRGPGRPPALHGAAGQARGARAHPRRAGAVRELLPGSVPSPAAAAGADLRFVR